MRAGFKGTLDYAQNKLEPEGYFLHMYTALAFDPVLSNPNQHADKSCPASMSQNCCCRPAAQLTMLQAADWFQFKNAQSPNTNT